MRLGITWASAVRAVAAVVVLTLLADVAKDSSQSAEIDDLRSQLEAIRKQLNGTEQHDLVMWDATVAVEERIRLKVKDAMELEYGLAKQGELMVKLAHEVKKLKAKADAAPARARRSVASSDARTFKHVGTTGVWGGHCTLAWPFDPFLLTNKLTPVCVPPCPQPRPASHRPAFTTRRCTTNTRGSWLPSARTTWGSGRSTTMAKVRDENAQNLERAKFSISPSHPSAT